MTPTGPRATNVRAPPKRTGGIDTLNPELRRMLEAAGFTYDKRLDAWFSLDACRVIAFDRLADMTPERLAAWLASK